MIAFRDEDAREALRRFDEDAQLLCAAAARHRSGATSGALHGVARAAYREALENATGPQDRIWTLFIRAVAALVANSHVERGDYAGRAAYRRLRRLVAENADLVGEQSRGTSILTSECSGSNAASRDRGSRRWV